MKESKIIKRLQANNMVGCAMKTIVPEKIVSLYPLIKFTSFSLIYIYV
jgi:hypothetical protein